MSAHLIRILTLACNFVIFPCFFFFFSPITSTFTKLSWCCVGDFPGRHSMYMSTSEREHQSNNYTKETSELLLGLPEKRVKGTGMT